MSETVHKFNDDGMKVVIKYCFESESGISLDKSSPLESQTPFEEVVSRDKTVKSSDREINELGRMSE